VVHVAINYCSKIFHTLKKQLKGERIKQRVQESVNGVQKNKHPGEETIAQSYSVLSASELDSWVFDPGPMSESP